MSRALRADFLDETWQLMSSRMGMSTRLPQASYANLCSGVFALSIHRFGVESLCSYARCGSTGAKLFAVTLHPPTLIAACCARWDRASQAWRYPCCSLSAPRSQGDGGPTAGARPHGEPLRGRGLISICFASRSARAQSCSELVSGRPLGTFKDDSDNGLVGDNARRRPPVAAHSAAAPSTNHSCSNRGVCK